MYGRIAQNRRALLVLQLTNPDGTAAEDAIGDVPVAVTRDDGSAVSNGLAAHPAAGRYEYTLTPADTAQLDRLRVVWTPVRADVGPEVHEHLYDVVGRHWIEVDSLRALDPLQDAARYTVARLTAVRDAASEYLERATRVAWVPHYGRELLSGYGSRVLALEHVRVRRLVRVVIGYGEPEPQPLEVDAIAGVHLRPGGGLYRQTAWPADRQIEVVYEHGYDAPPADGQRALQLLCRRTAIATYGEHAVDDRARGIVTDVGTIDLVVASAGVATDVPEVNAWIAKALER